jgi:hypothetical protein
MRIGHRVVNPGDVGRWEADLIQITVYRGMPGNLRLMHECAGACRRKGIPFVVHPVSYRVLHEGSMEDLRVMAGDADMALILHDEPAPGGGRLSGPHEERFLAAIEELGAVVPISFENALNTADAPWFWARYAESVTLDLGHMEAAGLDSVEYVASLDEECIRKVKYVHIHRNGRLRGGLTDHWPLRPGCSELRALRELMHRTRGIDVILEINETEETGGSLGLLRSLREEMAGQA